MKEPKIRFKGFKGEWVETPLLDVVTLYNGLTYTPNDIRDHGTLVLRSSNVQEGEISLFDNVYVRSEVATSPNVKKGDIIVVVRNGSRTLIGKHAQIKSDMPNTVIGAFMAGIHTDEPEFLNALLCTRRFDNEVTINLGATINQITNGTFHSMKFLFPDKKEQKALGAYFQHLDSLIQSTTKKIESLKQVKAASLQSMFPQEGETTPRVRFKGFEGEWEKVQFSELYEPSSIKNKTFGADKIISVANMYFKPVSYISDEEYLKSYNVMNLGDIAFEGNKSKDYAHGRFVENTIGDGIVSHVFIVLKPISKQYDLQFWKYLINYERIMGPILLRSTKHSTMMTDLVVSDFLKESVLVPSYEEQIEIGKILSSLDRQITLHTQRLEKLKQIKTACLDEMFV